MTDLITKTHQFSQSIGLVWEAISRGEEISTWFIQADFKAEVGYQYTFTHQQTKIKGEVTIVNPVTELAYTWVLDGTEVITTVRWKLKENSQGTLLTLEHSGISQYPGDTAVVMFNNYTGGWDTCIANLEKHFAEK